MRSALTVSVLLHSLFLGLLFLDLEEPPTLPQPTSVELVSLGRQQMARKQRVKGVKNPPIKKLTQKTHTPKTLVNPEDRGQAFKKMGEEREDVSEVKASSLSSKASAMNNYSQELKAFIEKNRYYPRQARMRGLSGLVKVKLTIASDGAFSQVEIIEPAKIEIFNRAVKNLFSEMGSFKPLPQAFGRHAEFIVPIKYEMKSRTL